MIQNVPDWQKENVEYWQDRIDAWDKKDKKDEQKYYEELQKILNQQSAEISKEVLAFYSKYAKDNKLSINEVKKMCTELDIREYEEKAKQYVKNRDFSEQANKEMKLYNLTMKTSRLQLLKARIDLVLKEKGSEAERAMAKALYDQAVSQFERVAGFMGKYLPDVKQRANTIVHSDFHAGTWSKRIWKHQIALRNQLGKILSSGFIQGKAPVYFTKEIKKRHNVTTAQAVRLLRTEFTRVRNEASFESYEESDIKEFIILNSSADRLCPNCAGLGGQKHLMKDKVVGLNVPPFHPNCRCNIAPCTNKDLYKKWLDSDTDLSFSEYKKYGDLAEEVLEKQRKYDNLTTEKDNLDVIINNSQSDIDKKKKNIKKCKKGSDKYNTYFNEIQQFTDLTIRRDDLKDDMADALKDLNESKTKLYKAKISGLEEKAESFDTKTAYLGIWKDAKTLNDFLKIPPDKIQAKKDYFLQQITDPYTLKSDVQKYTLKSDVQKFESYLKQIENLEKRAVSYRPIYDEIANLKNEIRKLSLKGKLDNQITQERRDNAYWFTSQNGGAMGAYKVLKPATGNVWQQLDKAHRTDLYDYTHSYSCINEPLRGIHYGTSAYYGVGNIDFDEIGTSGAYNHFKRGEVRKKIQNMTEAIDLVTYDFDIWFNRGCRYTGMDKFLNVPIDILRSGSEKDLKMLLEGKEITEHGFLSCGTAKGSGFTGYPITFNVFAPEGTKMIYAEPFSEYGKGSKLNWNGVSDQNSVGKEAEIILQRGTTFRIQKVYRSKGIIFIDMDVVSQEGRQDV